MGRAQLRPRFDAEGLCSLAVDIAHGRYDAIRAVVKILGGTWDESPEMRPPVARMPHMVVGMPTLGMDTACMVQVGFIVFGSAWARVPEMRRAWQLFLGDWSRQPRKKKREAAP